MNLRRIIKKVKFVRDCYYLLKPYSEFFRFRPLLFIKQYIWYFSSLNKFKELLEEHNSFSDIIYHPCLFDNITYTPIEPVYFYQDCWFAKHIFKLKPSHHYDIGSSLKTIGIISQFVPVTFIDIRPPAEIELPNLTFIKASVTNLPFKDESIESISSLCVIEHIGLGRYGDGIDVCGSEKAILEVKRVLKKDGYFFLSLPVDSDNKVYFNAHRAFTREYILELCTGLELLDEKYIYGYRMLSSYDKSKGFGTGLFLFRKKGG